MYTLDQVNALDAGSFAAVFGRIYEHSPWVAERAAAARPFASFDALADAMQAEVDAAPREARLALVRAHPQLLGRLAPSETPAEALTKESRGEQSSAGLDRCSQEELDRLGSLNVAYREKFGFPFVVAVRGLTPTAIIERMIARTGNDAEQEFRAALVEISKIARLRLAALVG